MRWRLGVVVATLALIDVAGAGLQRFEAVQPHMGTLVRVTVYTAGAAEADRALGAAFARIAALDAILSDYKPDSELSTIVKTAVGRSVPIGEDLFAVLEASQDLARATNGAFDVTQGPVIRLWREARRTGRIPEPAALRDAAARSGFRKLHLDAARRTVRLDVEGMALDVGGIGKGYAASEALETLEALGVRSALVAVSGDLAFSAAPPGQRGWRVSVHSEDPSVVGLPQILELTHAAVSTSGSSEQHLDTGGRRYSHIIEPASGKGLVDDITVTVIARQGLDADGLDTAASVLGDERGLTLVERRPTAAALIVRRTSSGIQVRASSRFLELAKRQRQ